MQQLSDALSTASERAERLRIELARRAKAVEEALDAYLPAEGTHPERIHAAMRYSALGGGKRLRGALALAAAGVVGGREEQARPVAAALEMIHAYSLVHDDLPCMDDDDFRRGKPSTHRAFGEALAVLAGDALLTHAFGLLSRLPEEAGVDGERTLRIVRTVADACGTGGLIGGQVVDLESEGQTDPSASVLEFIHAHKTGALFTAAVVAGGIAGGAGEGELSALGDYGRAFGLAFQITDDLLDAQGSETVVGKPVGSDAKRGKLTYVSLYGVEEARRHAERAARAALEALSSLPRGADRTFLEDLAHYVVSRDR